MGGRKSIASAAFARCRRKPRFPARCRRNWRNAVSNFADRPSSMPSCRRWAWSTIILSAAIAMRGYKSWRRRISSAKMGPRPKKPAKPSIRAVPAPRAWQRMLSGRRLDLLDPSPLDIEIEDIAHGLVRVARWNGQTSGAHIYSVAQHCLFVEALDRPHHPPHANRGLVIKHYHEQPQDVNAQRAGAGKTVIGDAYKA